MKDRFLIVMEVEANINLKDEVDKWGTGYSRQSLINGARQEILDEFKRTADCMDYETQVKQAKIYEPAFMFAFLPQGKKVKQLWIRLFGEKKSGNKH